MIPRTRGTQCNPSPPSSCAPRDTPGTLTITLPCILAVLIIGFSLMLSVSVVAAVSVSVSQSICFDEFRKLPVYSPSPALGVCLPCPPPSLLLSLSLRSSPVNGRILPPLTDRDGGRCSVTCGVNREHAGPGGWWETCGVPGRGASCWQGVGEETGHCLLLWHTHTHCPSFINEGHLNKSHHDSQRVYYTRGWWRVCCFAHFAPLSRHCTWEALSTALRAHS